MKKLTNTRTIAYRYATSCQHEWPNIESFIHEYIDCYLLADNDYIGYIPSVKSLTKAIKANDRFMYYLEWGTQ